MEEILRAVIISCRSMICMGKDEFCGFAAETMTAERLEEYVDVFINVFTKEPWNDVYESRGQVRRFFENYMTK